MLRLVHAAGFLRKQVAGHGERAGAGASADLAILADAAPPFQVLAIAQGTKQRRVAVNVGQRLAANVAAGERKESARKDLAQMRDENQTLAVVNAAGRATDDVRSFCTDRQLRKLRNTIVGLPWLFAQTARFRTALREIAAIVLRFGALDIEEDALRCVI